MEKQQILSRYLNRIMFVYFIMEPLEYDPNVFFSVLDKYIVNDTSTLDMSLTLDEIGKFCNLFLRNLSSLLKSLGSSQFDIALKKCKDNITTLQNFEKDPGLNQIMSKTLRLLDKIPSDEAAINELFEINYTLYSAFQSRMLRAYASLIMNTTPMNKTKTIADAEKKALAYITNNLPDCKPPEKEGFNAEHHPFLLDSAEFKAFSKYLIKHTKKAPVCECNHRATVFAYPCHCPVGCSECWKQPDEMICPECGEEVEEFIHIQN